MYLFVYGVMRKNCANHYFLKDCPYIGVFETEQKYQIIKHQNFPYASDNKFFDNEDYTTIIGEVYQVTEQVLSKINTFSGYPNYYKRELITVTNKKNLNLNAHIYLLTNESILSDIKEHQNSKYDIITSGDFLNNL
jgi:gamma-glutamylcyclotransferase (GGCT)/AIG2-like uncharacterized protein YtfP